jgi:hypothetical protein
MARSLWLPGATRSSTNAPPTVPASINTAAATTAQATRVGHGLLALAAPTRRVNRFMVSSSSMAPGGMSAAATYGNEGAASRRCRRHPRERSMAPPKGWISNVGSRQRSPMRRRPQPAYGWATACHARRTVGRWIPQPADRAPLRTRRRWSPARGGRWPARSPAGRASQTPSSPSSWSSCSCWCHPRGPTTNSRFGRLARCRSLP